MIRVILLFFIPFYLYASKILSYNIYDRTDRVDVMITFDTPYEGIIKQSITKGAITVKLEDASIESSKIKDLSSKYIKSITITPMKGYTQLVAAVPPSVNLHASKTSDSYGLRLRFSAVSQQTQSSNTAKQSAPFSLSSLPTKKSDDISQSYYIVITILVLGILIMLYIKKRVTPVQNKQDKPSWLFKENQNKDTKDMQRHNNDNVSIRFQKNINDDNSVVMLDFKEQSYLVLMGKNNILLDRFTDDKPITQDDFDSILQNRHKELESFLNSGDEEPSIQSKEYFQTYREKAASMLYES